MSDHQSVRGSAAADVVKVWVWALASLALALWLTPVAFNAGKALSELSVTKDFNGLVNRFAVWAGTSQLEDFFKLCWPLAALLLLFPLIEWLQLGNERIAGNPWRVRIPHHGASGHTSGQAIQKNSRGLLHGFAGFLIVFGCFILIGVALIQAGAFVRISGAGSWIDGIWADAALALADAILIEVFFRRVVLGIFLRPMKPLPAIAMAALMFGSIPFILSGFAGTSGVDGETLSGSISPPSCSAAAIFRAGSSLFFSRGSPSDSSSDGRGGGRPPSGCPPVCSPAGSWWTGFFPKPPWPSKAMTGWPLISRRDQY